MLGFGFVYVYPVKYVYQFVEVVVQQFKYPLFQPFSGGIAVHRRQFCTKKLQCAVNSVFFNFARHNTANITALRFRNVAYDEYQGALLSEWPDLEKRSGCCYLPSEAL